METVSVFNNFDSQHPLGLAAVIRVAHAGNVADSDCASSPRHAVAVTAYAQKFSYINAIVPLLMFETT
jgi:hypothetical protein